MQCLYLQEKSVFVIISYLFTFTLYSGDLNSKLVWYKNGPKQFVHQMVGFTSHVLNSKLIVRYLNGKKFGNQMAFGELTFYHGCI